MAERPPPEATADKTEAAEEEIQRDSADTDSWLVEELTAREPAPPDAAEQWRPDGYEAHEPGKPAPPDAAEQWRPDGYEAPEPESSQAPSEDEDDEAEPSGAAVEEAAPSPMAEQAVEALSRDLARLRVEADRGHGELRDELTESEKRLEERVATEVRTHAEALDRRRQALGRAFEGLTARVHAIEDRFDSLATETAEIRETLAVIARHRQAEPGPGEGGEGEAVDLNRATFEDLRGIGLSSTQAARVISHRDANGGFDSTERLREVPGLPDKLVDQVRSAVTISTSPS